MNQNEDKKYREILQRTQSFCARDEKCLRQVRQKLTFWGATASQAEDILQYLTDENFINEERFAREFARGKFRINKWGKVKIAIELMRLHIPEESIRNGLDAIDPDDYVSQLRKILLQRSKSLNESNPEVARKKLATFALGKGFEGELVWGVVREEF
ncbi:MAG: regulatory protein RecX [Bacteroidales bacterium]|nr:regulatory protein RecX [Bacteroidales bacterium]